MNVYDAILKRRAIRKFEQRPVPEETLRKLINAARLAPQARNLQPLKYLVVNDPQRLGDVFACTKWAAQLSDGTPKEGETPMAYVVLLVDKEITQTGYDIDAGAAGANLMLAAVGEGLGTCWIGSVDRDRLRTALRIPERYIIHTLIALGYPAEAPVAEDAVDGSVRYYKDDSGTLHVPKRPLDEVMFLNQLT